MKLLIVYGTTDGQTAKIAGRIAESAVAQGLEAELIDSNQIPADFSMQGFDGVLVGSPLRRRHYATSVDAFIREHKSELESRPSAFFSVSLGDASYFSSWMDTAVQGFLKETGWQPTTIGRFGGALKYTIYDFWTRFFMGLFGWIMGYPTDTSRDHELTDWDEVTKFTNEFITIVEAQQSSG